MHKYQTRLRGIDSNANQIGSQSSDKPIKRVLVTVSKKDLSTETTQNSSGFSSHRITIKNNQI